MDTLAPAEVQPMRSPIPRLPNHDIPPQRRQLYYAGMAVSGVGLLLFLSNFCLMPLQFGDNPFQHEGGPGSLMFWFAARAIGGMVLIMAGSAMMNIGVRGWAGSGLVLDPQRARKEVEPWARMGGGVVNDALDEVDVVKNLTAPRPESAPVVKVRCRHCQALNDEHDKFCGQCGQAL